MRGLAVIGVMVVASMALDGCGASVADKNMAGIWFKEPFIGGWSEQDVAEHHCAQYGRHAVYAGTLLTGDPYGTPVRAYNCQ